MIELSSERDKTKEGRKFWFSKYMYGKSRGKPGGKLKGGWENCSDTLAKFRNSLYSLSIKAHC